MEVKLYNTMGRELQVFKPIEEKKAGIYTCGPTVYNYAHIGNLRAYIFEDILRRTMEAAGYKVKHVMNITDVGHLTDDADSGDDKMIRKAKEKKQTVEQIAEYYTGAFFKDTALLNIKKPTIAPKATEHVEDMIKIIGRIEENGYTYQSGGNLYFDISKYPEYGKMALLDLQNLEAGRRIEVDKNKKNPLDFVLWFTKSKFENQAMVWESPWGRGYPGWHIECSAMSIKYLGEHFDIHCGGIDHIPIHHTNEIAQSEAATGRKWVNYWLHNEFIVLGKDEKMSKSKGNFKTLAWLIEQGYEALDYRFFCISGHYRSQLQFSMEAMDSARNARKSLMERIAGIKEEAGPYKNTDISGKATEHLEAFKNNAAEDMNTPRCLSDLWGLLKDGEIPADVKMKTLLAMDEILGLDLEKAQLNMELDEELMKLIDERQDARKNKDWTRADEIRDIFLRKGITLKDTPDGIKWIKN